MAVNCFHAFDATIADFDVVSVKDLVEAVVCICISSGFKKYLSNFVNTFLLKGRLNQHISFAFMFVVKFCISRVLNRLV